MIIKFFVWIMVVLFSLTSCTGLGIHNRANEYLTAENGKMLQLPASATQEGYSHYYEIPADATVNKKPISLAPPDRIHSVPVKKLARERGIEAAIPDAA